jgi:hypothetical protein
MLVECDFEEAEYAIFETDRFGFVNTGELYEIQRNEVTDESYVIDKNGQHNYGVFLTSKGHYYKFNNKNTTT